MNEGASNEVKTILICTMVTWPLIVWRLHCYDEAARSDTGLLQLWLSMGQHARVSFNALCHSEPFFCFKLGSTWAHFHFGRREFEPRFSQVQVQRSSTDLPHYPCFMNKGASNQVQAVLICAMVIWSLEKSVPIMDKYINNTFLHTISLVSGSEKVHG